MKTNITNTLIKNITPKDKPYDIRDQILKGFLVRVNISGKLVFMCQYARGKRISLGRTDTISLANAREAARQVIADVAKGIDPTQARNELKAKKINKLTFNNFMDDVYQPWLEAHRGDTAKDTCVRLRNTFAKLLGYTPLDEINPLMIEKWRVKRLKKDNVTAKTVNRQIALLKAALSRAKKWQLIDVHPLVDFEMVKSGDTSRMRYLSNDEHIRLVTAIEDYEEWLREKRDKGNVWRKSRHYDLKPNLRKQTFASDLKPKILITLGSGMRKCELRRIRREKHIDFENQGLKLTKEVTKTKKPRFIPLNNKTWKVLIAWLKQTEETIGEIGLVFPGLDGKSEFNNMQKSWTRVLEMASIKDFTWHDMRHDYASQLVMSGADLNTVRELLGHSDIKMTLVYAHLAPEHKKKAVEQLGKRMKSIYHTS